MTQNHLIGALVALFMVGGCVATHPRPNDVRTAQQRVVAEAREAQRTGVVLSEDPYVSGIAVPYLPKQEEVSLRSESSPIGQLAQSIAAQLGYSLSFFGSADPMKPVAAEIRDMARPEALRALAESAGYVALIQDEQRRVIVAPRGTYTFRLPPELFKGASASYAVGGNASSGGIPGATGAAPTAPVTGVNGNQGSPGAPTGSTASGMQAAFTVSGATIGDRAEELVTNLRNQAGTGALVELSRATGLLTVSADAYGLARARHFIGRYTQDVLTQVTLEVWIGEVQLNDAVQYSFDWQRLGIPIHSSGDIDLNIANGVSIPQPGIAGTFTSRSVTNVIKALQTVTSVHALDSANLMAQNHSAAHVFSGDQRPFVGSLSTNTSGLSGTVTVGASLSYVLDGLIVNVIPDVLDNGLVSLKIIPTVSTIAGFSTFKTAGGDLQGPNQNLRQLHLQLIAPSGQTLIVGGARQQRANTLRSGIPGVSKIPVLGDVLTGRDDAGMQTELLLLVNARIVPAPKYAFLIGETL